MPLSSSLRAMMRLALDLNEKDRSSGMQDLAHKGNKLPQCRGVTVLGPLDDECHAPSCERRYAMPVQRFGLEHEPAYRVHN